MDDQAVDDEYEFNQRERNDESLRAPIDIDSHAGLEVCSRVAEMVAGADLTVAIFPVPVTFGEVAIPQS